MHQNSINSLRKYFLIIFVLIIGMACSVTPSVIPIETQKQIEQSESKEHLFVAQYKDKNKLLLYFLDPLNEAAETKPSVIEIAAVKNCSYPDITRVQYDASTESIYYVWYCESLFDYPGKPQTVEHLFMANKDGSDSREIEVGDLSGSIVAIDPLNSSVILQENVFPTTTIRKIQFDTHKTIWEVPLPPFGEGSPVGGTQSVIAADGSMTYFFRREVISDDHKEKLYFTAIDNQDGSFINRDLFNGEITDSYIVSPDNKLVAFTSGGHRENIYVYDMSGKQVAVIPTGSGANHDAAYLHFLGNEKVVYSIDNTFRYYDLDTSQSGIFTAEPDPANYIYSTSPSGDYFAFQLMGQNEDTLEQERGPFKIYNVNANRVMSLNIVGTPRDGFWSTGDILAVSWYR